MSRCNLTRAVVILALSGPPAVRADAPVRPAAGSVEALIENLRAESVEVRREAAWRVRNANDDVRQTALPVLIALLKSEKDGQVRLAVFDAVTALGPKAEPAIPALVHTLRTNYGGQGKEELHQDYRSAMALAAIGRPAVESLRGLLVEPKENVRAEVVMALGRIGPDAGSATAELVGLLRDPSERIRREASLALGRIGAAAVEPLIAAIVSAPKDPVVRARAIESLGRVPEATERGHQVVLEHARDEAPEVRAAAVQALSRFGLSAETLLPVLKERLPDGNESVRLAAVNLLVQRPELLAPLASDLQRLLTSRDDPAARHAAFLLGKLGPEGGGRLLESLSDDRSRIGPISEALSRIGRPIATRLFEAVGSPDPRVRQGAALALGQVRPLAPDTVAILAAGLDDPNLEVKAAFLEAIASLGRRAGDAAPSVRALLVHDSNAIRLKAVDVLARTAPRDEALVADLAGRLDDPDPRVQREAIDVLRSLGPAARATLQPMIGKLDKGDSEVRVAAAQFIGSFGQAAIPAIPALIRLLDDASPSLRTIAAQTLGKLGRAAQPALPRLTPLLDDEQAEVREAAVMTLGTLELETEVLRPLVARAIRDRSTEVRRAALRVIQRLGPDGSLLLPEIILVARDPDNLRTVERSLRGFERRPIDPRTIPHLARLLEHDQAGVRRLAARFLGLAGASARDAVPALERLRADPSEDVRRQVERSLDQISRSAPASPTPRVDTVS